MSLNKILPFFIMLTIMILNLSISDVNAENDLDYIKIGLEQNLKNKTVVNVSGKDISFGIENGEMSRLFNITDQNIIAKSGNFSYHIEISRTFYSYNEALAKSKELGVDSYISYKNGFKVYIGAFTSEASAKDAINILSTSGILGLESIEVSVNEPLISIENVSGEKVISFDKNQKVYLKSSDDLTKLESNKYRGYISFINNAGKITTINYVKIGDYLKGVVPNEMPASWNIEALKAQTVAARSYTLRNLNKHKNQGYNLCDTIDCQAYGGFNKEHSNSNKAVEETSNKILKYNNVIADTVYSACNGGTIASNEDVWNSSPIPYLREKKDPYSVNTPHSNWTHEIGIAEASKLLKTAGYDVGQITSIEAKMSTLGVRVIELKVSGSNGIKTIPKNRVKNIFGTLKSTNYSIVLPSLEPSKPPVKNEDVYMFSGNDSKSKQISLNNINVITAEGTKKLDLNQKKIFISNGINVIAKDNQGEAPKLPENVGDKIIIKGSGYGHGVGMSQNGANNMAKQGKTYIEILEFYYTGTRVE